jgi:hypothetical protein
MPAHSDLLQAALIGYQAQIKEIETAMTAIRAQLKGSSDATAPEAQPRKKSKFSAAARKKMAAAQKRRWAAFHARKAAKS